MMSRVRQNRSLNAGQTDLDLVIVAGHITLALLLGCTWVF